MTIRTSFASLTAALLLATVVAPDLAGATGTDQQRCIAAKRQAAGRALSALVNCDAKAVKAGGSPDPACEDKARAFLTAQFAKFATKLPAGCASTGDATAVQPIIDAEQTDLETSQMVPGTASACTAAKLKATGKAGACGMKCGSRTALDGLPLSDPDLATCRSSCDDKLGAKLAAAEASSSDCHTTGDASTITTSIEGFVTNALAAIPPAPATFCDMPGALRFTALGTTEVPGGNPAWPDLSYLHLPDGFCVHYFGTVGNARQLRFAPGGELFVASPTHATTSNGPNGQAAIEVLPDDDHDGVADSVLTFQSGLPSTYGLLFTGGYFYWQDDAVIMRRPYTSGDRSPQGMAQTVASITHYYSNVHWPKPLDVADDGTIYMGNGGDDGQSCVLPEVFTGGVMKLDSPNGTPVASGFRNPIAIRCSRGHNLCFAIELAKDYSTPFGGREKLGPIQNGDDWGFPCCASRNLPYSYVTPVPDCSSVTMDGVNFLIGHTPFALDFAPATWPAPYSGSALVSLHGVYGSWAGASVVAVDMDETTGLPLAGSDTSGMPTGSMSDFATGWDDGSHAHGRPADLTFSSDGRLFLANDTNGTIVWIAPIQ